MVLTHEELRVLGIVERVASVFSIVGITTIILTFAVSQQFRSPVHRIVLINALYNIFDVLATTISLSGPAAGNSSHLCQFQGFLMQMFPVVDVLWTLAMACDVYLIVFYKYDTKDLRRLEKYYIAAITTLCFIPAFTFLFIRTKKKGPMYGSVTLWCSIAPHWVVFRIIFYYGPIWLVIFIVMIIYAIVGLEILKQRHILKALSDTYVTMDTVMSSTTNASFENSHGRDVVGMAVSVDGKVNLSPAHLNEVHHGTENEFASGSNSTSGASHLRSHHDVDFHRPQNKSLVSLRQYILMPMMFFVALLAIWVAPTTNRVATLINPEFLSYRLLLAVGSTGSLRGFWNGVVFVTLGLNQWRRRKTLKRNGSQSDRTRCAAYPEESMLVGASLN